MSLVERPNAEMVENVARAILAKQLELEEDDDKPSGWEDCPPSEREEATELARAALTAMPPLAEQWRPISEAPKGKKLITGYFNVAGKWRTVIARFYGDNTLPSSDECEFDGDFAPAGWYEESEMHETLMALESEPIKWQPLPAPSAGQTKEKTNE